MSYLCNQTEDAIDILIVDDNHRLPLLEILVEQGGFMHNRQQGTVHTNRSEKKLIWFCWMCDA
jgi:hypothetical protein